MRYLIERTSGWYENDPKVEGAYPVQIHEVIKSRNKIFPPCFTEACNNIRKEGDLWVGDCRNQETYWAIDINSLEELNALTIKVGHPIIVQEHDNTEGLMLLEIYDDYRE
jgi:hypothetical protein